METVPQRSTELFSHILNAHHIWNHRILQKSPEYGVTQIQPLKDWGDIHYENQRSSFEIITYTEDFEVRLDYENSEGRLFTNTIKDMLFHIINHSTHHRAQISMDFRNNGIDPLTLDFIFYKR
ncbi:DinB family protein [Sediminicola sp. 1XM1-17]|uniref:DinB family protein n=1 Tax=Sediminicola sp. 1XM1-17 TaxID=3127702 RepID=UPI003077E609